MDLSQLVAAVKQNAGIESSITDFDARIKTAINLYQKRLDRKELLPILETLATVYTSANSEDTILPAGLYPWRLYAKPYQKTTPTEIEVITEADHKRLHLNDSSTGYPTKVRFFSRNRSSRRMVAKWYPTPSASIAIYIPYWEYHRDLSKVHALQGALVEVRDAVDLATSVALVNECVTVYTAHIANTDVHAVADTTNTVAAAVATDLGSAITRANELKGDLNAHRSQATVHTENDTNNQVTSANATNQDTLNTLLNEMKGDLNEHILSAQENELTELFPDVLIHRAHLSLLSEFPDMGDAALVSANFKEAYESMMADISRMGPIELIYGGGEHADYADGILPDTDGRKW